MHALLGLLVLSLLLVGCGSQEPSEPAIQTAIAETQEAQAFEGAIQTAIAETQEAQAAPNPQPTVQTAQDTPAAEAVPTIGEIQPEATPPPTALAPTRDAESQEMQAESSVPTLVFSSGVGDGDPLLFATAAGKVFFQSGDNQITAVDIRTGKEIWSADTSGMRWADPDLVYAQPSERRIDALDANTGEFKWRYLSQQEWPSLVTATDELVVFRDGEYGNVVDKSNGNVISSTETGQFASTPCQTKGRAVVADDRFGFLSDSGRFQWVLSDVSSYRCCDGVFVYQSSGVLAAIDSNTGDQVWRSDFAAGNLRYFTYEGGLCGTGNVYVYADRRWHAISMETGKLIWSGITCKRWFDETTRDMDQWLGEADGMVVYSNIGYGLTRAYDATNHALLWENPQVVLSEIIGVTEDTLIGVSWEPHSALDEPPGIVTGLDAKTGAELWRSEAGKIQYGIIHYARLMYGRLFYVWRGKSGIRFADPRTGDIIAEIPFEGARFGHRFVATDGMIVVANGEELVVIKP